MGETARPTEGRRRRYRGGYPRAAATLPKTALLAAVLMMAMLFSGCDGENSSSEAEAQKAGNGSEGQDAGSRGKSGEKAQGAKAGAKAGANAGANAGAAGGSREEARQGEGAGEDGGARGEAKPEAVKGLYLPGFEASGPKLDEALRIAKETEVNAIVVDVKEAGSTTYPSNVPLAKEIGATTDAIPDLEALVQKLHDNDVYAIARLATFQDDVLPYARPDLAVQDSVTGEQWLTYQGAAWTNPYQKEVRDYNIAIAKEAAEAGFDEVQFDYVRFPSDGEMARIVYGQETFPTQEDAIANFLKSAHSELEPLGAEVSADVFGLVGVNDWVGIGQVVSKMAPHLDVLCPMVYPSHYPAGSYGYGNPDAFPYEIVDFAMADFKTKSRRVNPDIEIRPWLQDFDYISAYEPADVEAQMRATEDAGLEGWLLWNAAGEYTTQVLQQTSR